MLYDPESEALLLPFEQRSLDGEQHVPLRPLEMLTFAGARRTFPEAMILSPRAHQGSRSTYGSYPTDDQLGIGHPKPGMRGTYRRSREPFHPKEHVLVVGTPGKLLKAYPFAALEIVHWMLGLLARYAFCRSSGVCSMPRCTSARCASTNILAGSR